MVTVLPSCSGAAGPWGTGRALPSWGLSRTSPQLPGLASPVCVLWGWSGLLPVGSAGVAEGALTTCFQTWCVLLGPRGPVWLLTGLSWDIERPEVCLATSQGTPVASLLYLGECGCQSPLGKAVGRMGFAGSLPSMNMALHPTSCQPCLWDQLQVASSCSGLQTFCSHVRDTGGAFAFMESFLFQ